MLLLLYLTSPRCVGSPLDIYGLRITYSTCCCRPNLIKPLQVTIYSRYFQLIRAGREIDWIGTQHVFVYALSSCPSPNNAINATPCNA